jgi:hypothetical protein
VRVRRVEGTAETVCTGQVASRVIAAQLSSANIGLGGKWVSPYPLASNRDDLSGRSLAGPQIVLNGGAVAVDDTPPRDRLGGEPGQPPHHRANRPLPARGVVWCWSVAAGVQPCGWKPEGVGETRPLSCGVSHGTRTPVRGLDRARSRRPICALDLRRGQSEPASACTVIFAHWCTIGVSVIFSKGLLVHHPVCR